MQVIIPGVYFVGGGETMIGAVLAHVERSGVSLSSNPDVYVRTYGHFGIEDARELRARAQARAVRGGMRTFVIAASVMTDEAQNALLKTFEEPPAEAIFFLIVPSPEMLLATIRSRGQILPMGQASEFGAEVVDTQAFLAAPPVQRIEMLAPLLQEREQGGEQGKRDIGAILHFLAMLEMACEGSVQDERTREALRTIYRARSYATDKGALIKPLLESVALLV